MPAGTHADTAPAPALVDADTALSDWAARHTGPVTRHDSLDALRAEVAAAPPLPPTVLVALPATDGARDLADAVRRTTHRALELVGAWLREETFAPARLVFATRHAVPTGTGDAAATDPAQAAVWGLIRAAKAENPGRFGLLDHDGAAASLDLLPAVLAGGEAETALRDGSALAPRLTRAQDLTDTGVTDTPDVTGTGSLTGFDPSGTVLVTGASGVLARQVARHLVTTHAVDSLILASRRGPDAEGMDALSEELRGHGARVTAAACDVADRDALAALLAHIPADRPLTAVVHTAGVLDDGVVEALTPERVDTVLRAKADAAAHLDALTRDTHPVTLVLFSSLAGTFGGVGQGNYSAANAFLDALAARRGAEGHPALSLAWGLWAERSGMTGKLGEADLRRVRRGGVQPMDTPEALALFDTALRAPDVFLAPAALDPAALRASDGSVPHLLRDLVRARTPRPARASGQAADTTAPETADGLKERLAALPAHERHGALLQAVLAQAALVLGYDTADPIDPERGFLQVGFDSLTAVELRNRLGAVTGVRLPATLLFDYPTPAGLADHLLTRMAPAPAPATAGTAPASGDLVLAQLDHMEGEFQQVLADAGPYDELHDGLRSRLQRLLAQLDAAAPAVHQAAGTGHPDEVSDDELRRFLETELGGA
ncbi:SDR family NAD(P)-dependent oxidoreductase [Streptomyces sp. LN704]|uniref:type I polyketide synthase n=1 Tax=Streptomyces sp. LN704 TaxID=3112982 RepID=UPI00371BDEFD